MLVCIWHPRPRVIQRKFHLWCALLIALDNTRKSGSSALDLSPVAASPCNVNQDQDHCGDLKSGSCEHCETVLRDPADIFVLALDFRGYDLSDPIFAVSARKPRTAFRPYPYVMREIR